MRKYKIFLFDADDTLFDYDKAEAYALRKMFEYCGFNYSENIRMIYRDINAEIWAAYEKGEVSIAEFPTVRFARLFHEIGIKHDDVNEFSTRYLAELGKGTFLIEGAAEICQKIISNNKQIFIVTNGFLETQALRIKHSLIKDYISDYFVSSFVGYQKPDIRYFDYVFSHMPPVKKESILIVGDSLTADIAGGNNAGIDTCWFNAQGIHNQTAYKPTYEVNKLSEIHQFV